MRVLSTFIPAKETEEELERNFKILSYSLNHYPNSLTLYTDQDEYIGRAIEVYKREDHIVIIYEVNEKYRDELIKEGFIVI